MEFQKPLCLLFLLTLLSTSQANKINVGGSQGWVPNPSESYNNWAGRNRFQINDSIVFKYKKGSDSVLEVKKEDYDKCNKTNPIKKFENGDTEFKFDRSGPFYFISGKDGNCEKGQKLIVVVLSPRTPPSPLSPKISPLPSPKPNPPTGSPPASQPTSPAPSGQPPSAPLPPASSPVPAGGTPAPSPAATPVSPVSSPPAPPPGIETPPPTSGPISPPAPPGPNPSPQSAPSSNSTAPSPRNSGSSVVPSMVLVYSIVVGAALLRY